MVQAGTSWQQSAVFGEQMPCRLCARTRRSRIQTGPRQSKRISAQLPVGGAGALGPPRNGQLLRVVAVQGTGGGREERCPEGPRTGGASASNGGPQYLEFSSLEQADQAPVQRREPALVKVRLSVHYRVHSRQMLCIGGSQIPFGWSFLSIAKVPMTWSEGDIWTAEVELPANTRMEYKYVIMEEQDWTVQVSEDAEGVVSFRYRTQPDAPPDVPTIQKQMAIVAWQPGPNRIVQIPDLSEVDSLDEGEIRERTPARLQQRSYSRAHVGQSVNQRLRSWAGAVPADEDELAGTWETLSLVAGQPLVERGDVWGLSDPLAPGNPMEGQRFNSS